MMMRRFALTCMCLATYLFSQAQSPELQFSRTCFDSVYTYSPRIISADENGFFTFQAQFRRSEKTKKENPYEVAIFRKFDPNLNVVRERNIILGNKAHWESPFTARETQGNIHLFSIHYNPTSQKKYLYHRPIDPEYLSAPFEGNLIAEVGLNDFERWTGNPFSIKTSPASSKIAVFYPLPRNINEPYRVKVHVFDEHMEIVKDITMDIPYRHWHMQGIALEVTDNAEVYLLANINAYVNRRYKKRRHVRGQFYKLYTYSEQVQKTLELSIGPADRKMTDVRLTLDKHATPVCYGAYISEDKKEVEGLYTIRVNQWRGLNDKKPFQKISFREEVPLNQKNDVLMIPFDEETKRNLKLGRFDFKEILFKQNGDFVVTAEDSYYRVEKDYDYAETLCGFPSSDVNITNYHIRESILICEVSPKNRSLNTYQIKKYQEHEESLASLSFGMIAFPHSLGFLFHDLPHNTHLVNSDSSFVDKAYMDEMGDKALALALWNAQGEVSQLLVTETYGGLGFIPNPRSAQQISPTEILLVFRDGKRGKLAKLTVK